MKRGFSLLELVVAIGISAFLTVAAVHMSGSQAEFLNVSTRRVEMVQFSRGIIELVATDVRNAGVGIGYGQDGAFGGFIRGPFTMPGGVQFTSNNRMIVLDSGTLPTDDLGIRRTTGEQRTIATYTSNAGQICGGSGFEVGDRVVLMSSEGILARTAILASLGSAACTEGNCVHGCDAFTVTDDSTYLSQSDAASGVFTEGIMAGNFEQVVWFVALDNGRGTLMRANITNERPCATRDTTCGNPMMENVETFQVRFMQWDSTTSAWMDRTNDTSLNQSGRIRVDLELVIRTGGSPSDSRQDLVALVLEPGTCIPGPSCSTQNDTVARYSVRTSIDVKNSGRMKVR